jgi:hypothetical protein
LSAAAFKLRFRSDTFGKPLKVGDWVRLCRLPDLSGMSKNGIVESIPAFRFAIRHSARISYFEDDGLVCLNLLIPIGLHKGVHSIFVEPYLLRRI